MVIGHLSLVIGEELRRAVIGHWSIVICFSPKVAGADQAPKTSAVTSFQIYQVNWKMPWPRDAFISLPLSSALQ